MANSLDQNESVSDINLFNTKSSNSSKVIPEVPKPTTTVPCRDLLYYDMSQDKYLIIFNHYKFEKTMYFNYKRPSARLGTNEDVMRLTNLFEKMDYKVVIHHDLVYDDIINEVTKISKQDHSNTSCLCFAILTHGYKNGDIYAADQPYQFREVTIRLENGHPSLVGKPKIFFVQACRGESIDSGRRLEIDGGNVSTVIPSHADFLVLYSSVDGFISYRDREGSFLIQELCDVIEECHAKWDILRIITSVHKQVAYYRTTFAPNNQSIHDKKQMPETCYTLTKLFKF